MKSNARDMMTFKQIDVYKQFHRALKSPLCAVLSYEGQTLIQCATIMYNLAEH